MITKEAVTLFKYYLQSNNKKKTIESYNSFFDKFETIYAQRPFDYSGPNRPLNPIQIGHPIRSKSAGYSGTNQATRLRS